MPKILVALDLDRTLTKERITIEVLEAACQEFGIDTAAMLKEQMLVEANGRSFFPLEYLSKQLKPSKMDKLAESYIRHAKSKSLLYEDVLPFLDKLAKNDTLVVIVTYGGNDWQKLKLQASLLHSYNYIITDQKNKGLLISSWRRGKKYVLPLKDDLIAADKVILVDDKTSSFESLPFDCIGYLIRRSSDNLLPSQKGSVPRNVTKIKDLHDILKNLEERNLFNPKS
jgi:hypothetical protein